MASSKEGPLTRIARKLGLGKSSTGGQPGGYASCWGCSQNKCGAMRDNRCACCRGNHSGIR